jgi:MFS family permease
LHGINLVSLRQAVTPHRLQGRMSASFRYLNLLGACLGALFAGALAERVGMRTTLVVGVCGLLLPFLRLFFSPVRHLREVPAAE